MTWKRTSILIFICGLILLITTKYQIALGVLSGGLVFLLDIYLLKKPLEMMAEGKPSRKYPLILFFSLLRIIILGVILLIIIKYRIADIIGVFLGVTLPIASICSLLLTGGLTQWKV
jgi:hypothetical protein